MAREVTYRINILSNGLGTVTKLGGAAERATLSFKKLVSVSDSIAKIGFALKFITGAMNKLKNSVDLVQKAYNAQMVAERQLEQVMRNTIGATDEQIKSIKEFASAQQKLGVIGDEVQLAGAKELATYITKTESLKKLIPMMNDMLAHQYGLNASQEQAVQIAQMVGKVLDGQMGALSRAGYRFTEAEEKVLQFGNEQERVAALSQIVTKYVGGVNAALAATPEGKLKQHANTVGDLKERIGGLVVTIKTALLPLHTSISETIEKIISFFEVNKDRLTKMFATIAEVAKGAFITLAGAFKSLYNVVSKIWPLLLGIATAVALNNIYTRVSNGLRVVAIATTNLLRMARARENRETLKSTFALRANSIAKSWNAIVTHGAALSAIVFAGAIKTATGAIKGLSAAIYNTPIVGWIAAAIAAIILLFKILWDRCRGFREVLFGIWYAAKAVFHNIGLVVYRMWEAVIKPVVWAIWSAIESVFSRIINASKQLWGVLVSGFTWVKETIVGALVSAWEWLHSIGGAIGGFINKWIIRPLKNAFSGLWDFIKNIFSWIGDRLSAIFAPIVRLWKWIFSKDGMQDVGGAYTEGAKAGGESYDRDQAKKKKEDPFALPQPAGAGDLKFSSAGDTAAGIAAEEGRSTRNVAITINKLVETISINVTNLKEAREQIKTQVAEALLTAVNDVNLVR